MNACDMYIFISFYVVSAISVFLLQKTFVPKGFFLVIIEPFFSIKGSLELSKEPYASYIEIQLTLFSKSVHKLTSRAKITVRLY